MIRLSKSVIGSAERQAVDRILANGFLGMGPETQAFENELAAYIGGGAQVCCVNTGTSALHLAVQACGIGFGDEVLVPTVTFVASFQAASGTGAKPVACDVLENTITIDVKDAEKRITSRTKAVMPVHYAGGFGALDSVYEFARKHGLRVIEDAAHSFGGEYKGKRAGSCADIACFSFDGIKNLTSGEGGAVVSADPTVINNVKDARLLGVMKDTEKRYARERSWDFDVQNQGYRYHMSDIMAAIGRVQLKRFEGEFKQTRRALAAKYRMMFAGVPGLILLDSDVTSEVPHIFPVRILGGVRDNVREALAGREIQTGIHYKPNHLLSYYATGVSLPVAERVYEELLTLPLHPDLSENDVVMIADIVKSTLGYRN